MAGFFVRLYPFTRGAAETTVTDAENAFSDLDLQQAIELLALS
jgi:hypothetical protein